MNMRDIMQLIEAAPATVSPVLFHGTGCLNAAAIISENYLRQYAWDNHGAGVSFTGEKDSAEYFAIKTDTEEAARAAHHAEHGPDEEFYYDSSVAEESFPHLFGVVFAFDGVELMKQFKLKAINYTGDWDDEAEWRLMSKNGLPNMNQFLRGIYAKKENIQWWISNSPDKSAALTRLLHSVK